MSNVPSDLKYTDEHEYVRLEGDIATVGITQFACNQLGEVVFVELPKVGDKFDKGDEIGTVESVKAVSEIFAPVAGTIQAVNEPISDDPELVNNDPYGEGWMVKIKVDDPSSVANLLSASAYASLVAEEASE